MKTAIFSYQDQQWRVHANNHLLDGPKVSLVMAFGDKVTIEPADFYDRLCADYPHAEIVLCSTAGEIFDDSVHEGSVSVTAVQFEKTQVRSAMVNIADFDGSSYRAGKALIENLMAFEALSYVLILSVGGGS